MREREVSERERERKINQKTECIDKQERKGFERTGNEIIERKLSQMNV